MRLNHFIIILLACLLAACGDNPPNSPYSSKERATNRYYTSFSERPKTLDPARSYSSNEYSIISQILEPPLQYHYLKRPYTLIPQTVITLPKVEYLDLYGHRLPQALYQQAAMTRYIFTLKPDVQYAPHPGFAKDEHGQWLYHQISTSPDTLEDFSKKGTRTLQAEDYVYQIKRLADPKNRSPIFSIMKNYIVGLDKLNEQLKQIREKDKYFIDLRQYELPGAKVLSDSQWSITIKGLYPQFQYWLAMPFFSPVPWEVDKFYSQEALEESNINFDWYPVGTGPYTMTHNNPNQLMTLHKNPVFHGEHYPKVKDPNDPRYPLSGKALPFIDEIYFYLEKESIPRWAKFMQGYYDRSGVSSDSFDHAIQFTADGQAALTSSMTEKEIQLNSAVMPSIYYLGFNMLSDKVGGYSKKQAYLRQAISIAVDMEEFISIFMNGQGVSAYSPLPPGIFGYEQKYNPYVYTEENGRVHRKSISEAQKLLAMAGYRHGIDPKTKQRLKIYFDVTGSQGPDDKARFDWFRKQFKKIGIDLVVRSTHYNRFQEKIRTGNFELFFLGWNADYPDPENFMFLLYGPNSEVKHHGANASNYENKQFDRYFKIMRDLPNGPAREKIIAKMTQLLQFEAPWIFGFYPKSFLLSQQWLAPMKLNPIANNTLKYQKIDSKQRKGLQEIWNQPKVWPVLLCLLLVVLFIVPILFAIRQKEEQL